MVAIEPITLPAMQVDIVDAGAAVENGIVKDETLQVHHAQQFTLLHRHAVNRHTRPETRRHFRVQGGIACTLRAADQTTLRAVPIDEDRDLQRRSFGLGGVQGGKNLATGVIILEIERAHQNPLAGCGDQRQ